MDGTFIVGDIVVFGIGKRVVVENQTFRVIADDEMTCA